MFEIDEEYNEKEDVSFLDKVIYVKHTFGKILFLFHKIGHVL